MVFPSSCSTGPGLKLQGDWAKSWTHSPTGSCGRSTCFRGGKWSDGVPLTAEDAVWTIHTTLKYKAGATSYLAELLGASTRVGARTRTPL